MGREARKPALRVVLQNVGGQVQDVAKTPEGKLCKGADLPAFYPVEGLVEPVSVLAPR